MTNDELRQRAEAAREVAPGEWIHQRMRVERPFNGAEIGGGGVVRQKDKYSPIFHGSFASELGDYIAAMNPERAIELLDENDRLRGLLKRCEWSVHDDDYRNYCPICMEYQDDGHAPDCELAQALRGEG